MFMQQKVTDTEASFVKIRVPVDVTSITDVAPGQNVKIVAKDKHGNIVTDVVRLDEQGKAESLLSFPLISGTVRIMAGPENMTEDEMTGRTIFILLHLLPGMEYMGQEVRMNRRILKLKVSSNGDEFIGG